jgi:hypothetical protein
VTEVAVLIPVLGRPQNARPLIDSLTAATPPGLARPVFICTPGDDVQIAACEETEADTLIADWSAGKADWARKCELARHTTSEPFMLLAADDVTFEPGWAEAALEIFRDYDVGVVGTNDCANPTVVRGLHSTHPLVCRGYVDMYGTVDDPALMLPQCYWHNFVDTELVETAKARGCWAFAPGSRVRHANPMWGTAEMDDTYLRGRQNYQGDAELYRRRQKLWQRVAA